MDVQIVVWFQTLGSGFMDVVFGLFYYMLNPLFTLIVPVVLYYAIDKRLAYRTAVFYGTASFFNGTLKEIFKRPRPYAAHPDRITTRIESLAKGASMPSGHAMGSIGLFYPATMNYGRRSDTNQLRKWVFVLAAFVVVMIGFSRPYMGGHYLSDIIAGWGFGLVVVILLDLAMKKLGDKAYLYGLILIPIMLLIICFVPESDSSAVGMAFSTAMLIGGYLDHRFVKLDTKVSIGKRVFRCWFAITGAYIFGLLLVTTIFEAATGTPVNGDEVSTGLRTAGYFLMFFVANAWAYIACPFIFKYAPRLFGRLKKSTDTTTGEQSAN